jgi:hypothetical protein
LYGLATVLEQEVIDPLTDGVALKSKNAQILSAFILHDQIATIGWLDAARHDILQDANLAKRLSVIFATSPPPGGRPGRNAVGRYEWMIAELHGVTSR